MQLLRVHRVMYLLAVMSILVALSVSKRMVRMSSD